MSLACAQESLSLHLCSLFALDYTGPQTTSEQIWNQTSKRRPVQIIPELTSLHQSLAHGLHALFPHLFKSHFSEPLAPLDYKVILSVGTDCPWCGFPFFP
jgi:hypothetical protein